MSPETHFEIANFIWTICNLLRGPYKRNEYRKVILPLTVLRRFDCILAPTKAAVLKEHATLKAKPENVIRNKLSQITGHQFYNLSKLDLPRLMDDPNQLAPNLNGYINGFSPNIRAIMERFDFGSQIARMAEKDLLYLVIKRFASIDLSPARVDTVQMGYVFEELIRIGAEQSNEEAGEHFTPREVIKLMVNLLLSPEKDLARSHVVKTSMTPRAAPAACCLCPRSTFTHSMPMRSRNSSARTGTTKPSYSYLVFWERWIKPSRKRRPCWRSNNESRPG